MRKSRGAPPLALIVIILLAGAILWVGIAALASQQA